jgi:hypothetical protein
MLGTGESMSITHCKVCSGAVDTDYDNKFMACEVCLYCLGGMKLKELYELRDKAEDEVSKDLLDEMIAAYE